MRAIDPTIAIDRVAGEHSWFVQKLEPDTRSDDVEDRIERSDLMEMHLLRRQTVDLTFRDSDALKHRSGLFLYPIRYRARCNDLLYFGKGPRVIVVVSVRTRATVRMRVRMRM